MKVVLFCGGLGMRLREYSESVPKPMVPVGYRPILWHVMKYYAYYGHKDFILCLGHRADYIKEYFLNYNECLSNDFTLSRGAQQIDLKSRDIDDWTITFVDTGMNATIGQRLKVVQPYLDGEEAFLANYADNVSDLPLQTVIEFFRKRKPTAMFVSVRPTHSFHVVEARDDGVVTEIADVGRSNTRINGGFFVFTPGVFDYIRAGEELVVEPFHRLIAESRLLTYCHDGFWACLDTFKDKQRLDDLHARGEAPWEVWQCDGPRSR